jgi:proline iminopeptidase
LIAVNAPRCEARRIIRAVREEWIRTDDDIRLRVIRRGRGKPLVLCHGGPGLWDYLGPLATMLDDLVEVWRYDQRGCGHSEGLSGPYTLDRFLRDLEAIRRAAGHERWIASGHSWGATLALLHAVAYPERVRGLLYVCGNGIEWGLWKPAYHTERRRRLVGNDRSNELSQRHDLTRNEQRELLALNWATDYADFEAGLPLARQMVDMGVVNETCNAAMNAEVNALDPERLRMSCQRLSAPVLIVQGEQDPRPVQAVDSLIKALPNAERLTLRDSGHYPWVESRVEFRNAVRRWLGALEAV